jgi:hypothetical protein
MQPSQLGWGALGARQCKLVRIFLTNGYLLALIGTRCRLAPEDLSHRLLRKNANSGRRGA